MASESTPRSKLASTTTDNTDRDGAPRVDRHGADLPPGTIVGDYQIERKLGHGGMGSVYEAIHTVIEKRAAIKVLLPELSQNEEAVERFKSEARAVNRIRHPSIVDVFNYGTTEDGRCFLVMELLDGESLGRRLQYDAPTIAEACEILIAITHALDAAHATGIVHRDLKPDNVFLVEGKHVKLLDFGIAKLTGRPEAPRSGTEYTQPGQAMGTPRYIAPEQARGDAVDGRTDIYSLGVMAFELLVGRLPFVGDNPMELIAKHITLPPPTPSDLAPTLPPEADRLLSQMLDKNPVNRPTLEVVRAMLDEIRAPWVTSVTAREAVRPESVPGVAESSKRAWEPSPVVETTPGTASKRNWWPIAAIGGTVVAAALAFVIVRAAISKDEPAKDTEAAPANREPAAVVPPPSTPPALPEQVEVKPDTKPIEPVRVEARPKAKPDVKTEALIKPLKRPGTRPSPPKPEVKPPAPEPTPPPVPVTPKPKPEPDDTGLMTPPILQKKPKN